MATGEDAFSNRASGSNQSLGSNDFKHSFDGGGAGGEADNEDDEEEGDRGVLNNI
jgi:hypothetical protein